MIWNWIKANRKIIIPVVIVLLIGIGIWIWKASTKPTNEVEFSFDAGDDLQNLLNAVEGRYASRSSSEDRGIGIYLDVPISAILKNKSGKPITLDNISGNISYQGEPIFQTKAGSESLQQQTVPGNSQKPITDKSNRPATDAFQILVNGKTIKFLKDFIAGEKPKVDYMMNANVMGVPYLFKNSTVLNKGR